VARSFHVGGPIGAGERADARARERDFIGNGNCQGARELVSG